MPTNNPDCLSQATYESMTWCPGTSRTPGIRKRVFFQRKANITAFPTKNGGKYTGDFTLKASNYWKYMDVVVNSSKFSAETQGEYPCKLFRQHGEFFYPGLEEDITEFEQNAINDDLIMLVQQSNGKFKVLGCEEYQTDITCASDTGSGATDKCGVTITAECDAPTDLLIYSGKIMLSEDEDANAPAATE